MSDNNGDQNLENLTHTDGNYEAQRCPVCKGFGTVNYGRRECHACGGKGITYVPKRSGIPEYSPASQMINTSMQFDEIKKR